MKSTEESAGERYPLHLACIALAGLELMGGLDGLRGKWHLIAALARPWKPLYLPHAGGLFLLCRM